MSCGDYSYEHFQYYYLEVNGTRPHWWHINMSSGFGLEPSGNKPLPKLMSTKFYDTICDHKAKMS